MPCWHTMASARRPVLSTARVSIARRRIRRPQGGTGGNLGVKVLGNHRQASGRQSANAPRLSEGLRGPCLAIPPLNTFLIPTQGGVSPESD